MECRYTNSVVINAGTVLKNYAPWVRTVLICNAPLVRPKLPRGLCRAFARKDPTIRLPAEAVVAVVAVVPAVPPIAAPAATEAIYHKQSGLTHDMPCMYKGSRIITGCLWLINKGV